jgi:hypothetical protein
VSRPSTNQPTSPPKSPSPKSAHSPRVRAGIERVFAVQKDQMGLFIRTIELDRARTKIGLANLTFTLKRLVWFERQAATA